MAQIVAAIAEGSEAGQPGPAGWCGRHQGVAEGGVAEGGGVGGVSFPKTWERSASGDSGGEWVQPPGEARLGEGFACKPQVDLVRGLAGSQRRFEGI